nr:F-box protein SKIP14-like [Ipomoea trifida]
MALNYSHRPIFPAHISEDNLVSPMRIVNGYLVEGVPDKTGEGFIWPRHTGGESEEWFEYGRERVDSCGLPESASKDIIDLLPSDPFEMGASTYPIEMAIRTTVTALTGWLKDLEIDCGGSQRDIVGPIKEDYSFLIWNNAMRFQQFPSHYKLNISSCMNPSHERAVGDELPQFGTSSTCSTRDIGFDNGYSNDFVPWIQEKDLACSSDDKGEAPHEGLSYALNYLGVKDLLSVQMVCKSLCSTVKNDPLLWRSIHIDKPLNERITDDVLQLLTSRAQGSMECLSLVECPRITDDGLRRVLEANPHLTKLCVPGCTRLSIEGIMNILRAFNSKKGIGIRHLRIGGLYGVTHEHYEGLKSLLGAESLKEQNDPKPHFYLRGSVYRLCDDDRPIDIEVCPRCEKMRLVYDCPSEGCQVKDRATQGCRACTLCIARCVQCGKCINDGPYEETFCLENLCTDCRDQIENQERHEEEETGVRKHLHPHERGHNISLHG